MVRRFSTARPIRTPDAYKAVGRAIVNSLRAQEILALRGRPGLSRIALPPCRYRVDLQARRNGELFFDRPVAKRAEDLFRASRLQRAQQLTPADQEAAQGLAVKLIDAASGGEGAASLASAMHMRDVRIRVTGALWQLHRLNRHQRRSLFTLIPRGLNFTPEELRAVDVRQLLRALRSALNRAGACYADGALLVFLHGEYDENTGRYQLHFHGWAAGEMVDVVRRLRRQRAYNSSKKARAHDTDGVTNRVVVSRGPIRNPAYRLSYMIQSFWPHRPTGVLAETHNGRDGRFRVRGKRRIPEPMHSQQLVWLDQWRLEDISLLMKVSVVQGRLRLTNAKVAYTNGRR